MKSKFDFIQKREGRLVPFDKEKIINAVFAAARAAGGSDRKLAEKLADQVISYLNRNIKQKYPTVEQIQDAVERILIEEGHARTAKAYISYRQKRSEVRSEKAQVLQKERIDEVDKSFDLNALKVLTSRYLRKDESGKLTECPKELFTRVSVHTALPDLLYDSVIFSKVPNQKKNGHEKFVAEKYDGKIFIGKYALNKHHLEGLKRTYDRMASKGHMKIPWKNFLDMLSKRKFEKYEKVIDDFYNMMVSKKFLPNTPALANFGNPLGMGSACFVLDIEDSMEEIMETLKKTALVFKAGGGMGYNFSKLRPEGDFVSSTHGLASGPLSFMRLFDTMTEVIKQGGIRRGANMGILNSNHPDIEHFVKAKEGNKALRNFNISVMVMGDFWECYRKNKPYPLLNPRSGKVMRTIDAKNLFDIIVHQAWESAEPGVIYFDNVNKYNPLLEGLGPIYSTNPCGEVLLYPNESCNLGSINIWAFCKEDKNGKLHFDWEGLKGTILMASHFLDNVIDINKFPLKDIEEMSLNTRKIGLGIMGVADAMFEMEIPYSNPKGRSFMEELMEYVNYYSKVQSIEMGKKRGKFPFYNKSFYSKGKLPVKGFEEKKSWHFDWNKLAKEIKKHGLRNSFTTVIAPTGSISMIAGCSSGIEPMYSLVFEKNVKVGSFYYVNRVLEKRLSSEGLFDDLLVEDVVKCNGSVQTIGYIPPRIKNVFVTSHDIVSEDHIRALASFQKWTDSSISKTINFPADVSLEEMEKAYVLAHDLGCKDVTVYRDSSLKEQVLITKKRERKGSSYELTAESAKPDSEYVVVGPANVPENCAAANNENGHHMTNNANIKKCPNDGAVLIKKEGCTVCPVCGYGLCSND
ncbi:MAG: ribonucleoside-diphosphate reductase, adenosylcobalamin-dependent [Candidatus Diapherotrites archaeon CG08_land_8_20_14_0_20_34_12]|nr:MAG: ribonucleoside-diphosphate reductase, adenosylcobalamin-dependent [Candidatus Diapherotrites archaeon CG08_land_8_20_14_0_20_34_12]